MAALASKNATVPVRPAAKLPPNSSLWLPYVPLLLAGTIGPAIVMDGFESLLVPFIVVAVCVRQSVAAWENRRLLRLTSEQALRDPLTGLANRTLFNDRLAHAMMLRSRGGGSVAVVSLDLDDFKLVNDSLGHPTADHVLVEVGRRISASIRNGDTAARLGGDEFAILLEEPIDDAHVVVRRVVEAIDRPFGIDGQDLLMRPSIGVAIASPAEPEVSAEQLLKRADAAMYAAKRSRTTRVHTFDASTDTIDAKLFDRAPSSDAGDGTARVRLFGELRHAIEHRGLALVYQPIFELSTERLIGVEALLRWPHHTLGQLVPGAFLPMIHQHGLMRPVTDLVLDIALDDVACWRSRGREIPVAVNLFAPSVRDTRLPEMLIDALSLRDLPPRLLTVELTEDMVLGEVTAVTAVLQRIRDLGIRVSIDDFGSGYSALSYLRELSIDEVKLDRQLVAPLIDDPRAASVAKAVIELTHELGVTVVAEGIEDAPTAAWLRDRGCDAGQGYYFGRPVGADQILDIVGPSLSSVPDRSVG